MSKNNLIKKSDKKFIRREKAWIREAVLDVKKQEEMINELYKKFLRSAIKEQKPKGIKKQGTENPLSIEDTERQDKEKKTKNKNKKTKLKSVKQEIKNKK